MGLLYDGTGCGEGTSIGKAGMSEGAFLYTYGLHKADERMCERAGRFLEELKAESNHIIRSWSDAGLPVVSAADSQALIQLQKEYCDKRKCLYCRFGYEYLKHT